MDKEWKRHEKDVCTEVWEGERKKLRLGLGDKAVECWGRSRGASGRQTLEYGK